MVRCLIKHRKVSLYISIVVSSLPVRWADVVGYFTNPTRRDLGSNPGRQRLSARVVAVSPLPGPPQMLRTWLRHISGPSATPRPPQMPSRFSAFSDATINETHFWECSWGGLHNYSARVAAVPGLHGCGNDAPRIRNLDFSTALIPADKRLMCRNTGKSEFPLMAVVLTGPPCQLHGQTLRVDRGRERAASEV
jgi:hypothetical protein